VTRQLTLLWQTPDTGLREWILEVFSPLIADEVFDGQHRVVLDNCLIVDTHLHTVDPAYYPQFRGKNAFLMREPDEHFRDIVGYYINFCGVFRMHYSAAFRRERVMPVPLGYMNGLKSSGPPIPASKRKYVWSMLGQMNKSTRPDALRALLAIQPAYWYASDGWTPGAQTAATNANLQVAPASYKQLLADSAFSPAPMGNIQQETNRPFEALEAGSIPLLERRWLMDAHRGLLGRHPLPVFSSWGDAARFVKTMSNDPGALDQLQAECIAWWCDYKKRLTTEAVEFVDRLWCKFPESSGEFVRGYARLPGWSTWEILRHHSAGALRRRIIRQTRRVVEQGKFFERI
jgi:hypothetical protein